MLEHIQLLIGIVPGQQIHLTENLEGVNERKDGDEKHRGRKVAELYGKELIPLGRALDIRHLEQLLGNIRKPGHEEDHVIAEVLPQKQDDDDGLTMVGLEPVYLRDIEKGEELIDSAVIVKEHLPDEDDRRDRNHHGAEEEGAELRLHRDAALKHERQHNSKYYRKRHRYCRKLQGIFCRHYKCGVIKELYEVFKEHEVPRADAVDHRIIHHDAERDDEEHAHADKARRQEAQAAHEVLPLQLSFFFFSVHSSPLNC